MWNRQIILASKSSRRKELMEEVHIPFSVISEDVEEFYDQSLTKTEAIENIAYQKAKGIARKYPDAIVIGVDTMVCYQDHRLGKPKDKDDAIRMLKMLHGKKHEVISGVCILYDGKKCTFSEITNVYFYPLDERLLEKYVNSDEPYDKAGAYGIQGFGRLFVQKIEGDYFNVVGLPIARLYKELQKINNLNYDK